MDPLGHFGSAIDVARTDDFLTSPATSSAIRALRCSGLESGSWHVDPTKSSVELTIAAGSIDTSNADRDEHLKSPDFFDVAKHPNLTFKSTRIARHGKNKYKVTGDLTIRDVTKSATLDVTVSDPLTNPWGKRMRGVKVDGKINRHDYGLDWNKTLDKGGVLVGDEVTFDVQLEITK